MNNLVQVQTPSEEQENILLFVLSDERHPVIRPEVTGGVKDTGAAHLILPNPLFNYLQNYVSYAAAVLKQKFPMAEFKSSVTI